MITYAIALLIAIVSVLSVPLSEWQSMSLGQTLALGFSLLIGFCGVLLAYFVYLDGKLLSALQGKSRNEEREDSRQKRGEHELAFTMAHVNVHQLERPQ